MPPFGSITRRELIRGFRALGWDGPYPGGRHSYVEQILTKPWRTGMPGLRFRLPKIPGMVEISRLKAAQN